MVHFHHRSVMLLQHQKSLLRHINRAQFHDHFLVFKCFHTSWCMCACEHMQSDAAAAAAEQRKVKGTKQQQCPHMQSKCVCKATSIGGLARD